MSSLLAKHQDTKTDAGINCAIGTGVMVLVLTLMAAVVVEKQGRIVVPQHHCWWYVEESACNLDCSYCLCNAAVGKYGTCFSTLSISCKCCRAPASTGSEYN
jgi:sulfatase maturation enzyme AslB (radical SAM superfamily)